MPLNSPHWLELNLTVWLSNLRIFQLSYIYSTAMFVANQNHKSLLDSCFWNGDTNQDADFLYCGFAQSFEHFVLFLSQLLSGADEVSG
jgi:hypothetical protein